MADDVSVVNAPVLGVVAPIDILLIVLAVAGLSVTVPVPVGAIDTAALAGLMFIATSTDTLLPPPPPH